jgi:hypothetical protein
MRRSWAFDGTLADLVDVDAPIGSEAEATFTVHEWYRGGSGDTVTVAFGLGTADQLTTRPTPGTRLLVTGEPRYGGAALDDPVAWGCGFTQTWSESVAAEWRSAFAERDPMLQHDFTLSTECGIVGFMLDGVWWAADPVMPNRPDWWDPSEEVGTLEFFDDDVAIFVGSRPSKPGLDLTATFRRTEATEPGVICP